MSVTAEDSLDGAPGPLALAGGALFAKRFRVVRALGAGGMGAVYEAEQVTLGRRVALKLMHPALAADAGAVQRFQREARLMAALRHPNLVEVIDAGFDDGALWIAMELLDGESLGRWLDARGGRATPPELLPWVEPVGRALAFMHRRGIVHRDVKPDNVQLTRGDDGAVVPKLLDLGIAHPPPAEGVKLTATGAILGTPAYIAPEQALGVADLSPAADQWAFAAMLYEAFTGSIPHAAETPMGVITRRVTEPVAHPATLVPDFDPALAAVLLRALATAPAERFPSLDALLDALAPFRTPARPAPTPAASTQDALRDTALDAPPVPPTTTPRPARRVAALALATLAAAGLAVIALRPSAPARPPARVAAAPPPPDASPGVATFVLHFSPETARISLDGNEIGAGHASLQVPRDGRPHALRVEAPGAVPWTEVLRATGDVQISRALLPRDAGAAPPRAPHRPAPQTPALPARRPIDPTWPP